MTVAVPCQCAARSSFAFPLLLQQYTTSPTWKSSLRHALEMCSGHHRDALLECSVTRDTLLQRESLRLVPTASMAVVVLVREPTALSPVAELQAQVTAVVSHVTRCICSATYSTLNSSINRLACVFQTPPCRSPTAFCCGVMAAVGMSSQPMSSSSCPISRSNSPPWSEINLRGPPAAKPREASLQSSDERVPVIIPSAAPISLSAEAWAECWRAGGTVLQE